MEQRQGWAEARPGIADDDLPVSKGFGEPFCFEEMIGPIDPAIHDVIYRPNGSIAGFTLKQI
jgi:hypothetical protein